MSENRKLAGTWPENNLRAKVKIVTKVFFAIEDKAENSQLLLLC
jgi:hypothetical protein